MNINSSSRKLVVASAAAGLVLSGATGIASAQSDSSPSGTLSSDSLGDTTGSSADASSSEGADGGTTGGGSSDTDSAASDSSASDSSGSNPAASLAGSAVEMSTGAVLGSLRADGVGTLVLVGAGVAAGIYFAPQIHQSLTDAGVPLPPLP